MADFDTPSKRFSGMQMGEVPETTLPVPDGAVGADDQLHLLTLYSGIAASAPGGAAPSRRVRRLMTLGVH